MIVEPIKYVFFEETDSTQDAIIPFINNSKDSVFLISRIQHHGRGRKNDDWHSPSGGFWGTLAVPLPNILSELKFRFLHYDIVLVLTEILSKNFNISVKIKWPNDLVIPYEDSSGMEKNYKKLGGILLEIISLADKHILLIGIGINLNNSTTNFPEKLKNSCISVLDLTEKYVNISEFAKKLGSTIKNEIKTNIIENFTLETKTKIKREFNEYLYNLGGNILYLNNKFYISRGIDLNGFLLVENDNSKKYLNIQDWNQISEN